MQSECLNRRDLSLRIISLLNLKLRKPVTYTTDEIMISCPFHKDNSPSFGIDIKNGRAHCFSCGWSGSIESLYKTVTGQSIRKVLNLPNDSFSLFSSQEIYKKKLQDAEETEVTLKNVYITYNSQDILDISSSAECISYLNQRGISLDIAKTMNMRYCEEARINGTFFKRRLLIPVYENHRLISIEGRRIFREDPDPKVLYPKNCTVNTLYDIDNLNKDKPLYVCEGLMDLAVLRSCDFFENSTSVFGANITKRQLYLLKNFNKVIYINDLDEAGYKALDTLKQAKLDNLYNLEPPKSIGDFKIKDIGDIPKTGLTIQDLLNRRWVDYIKKISP